MVLGEGRGDRDREARQLSDGAFDETLDPAMGEAISKSGSGRDGAGSGHDRPVEEDDVEKRGARRFGEA